MAKAWSLSSHDNFTTATFYVQYGRDGSLICSDAQLRIALLQIQSLVNKWPATPAICYPLPLTNIDVETVYTSPEKVRNHQTPVHLSCSPFRSRVCV